MNDKLDKKNNELMSSISTDSQEYLLQTIQVPKNLHFLSQRLPKQSYDKSLKLEKLEKLNIQLSPNIKIHHIHKNKINETIEYLKARDHPKNIEYMLAPHHVFDVAREEKIIKDHESLEERLEKEKEFEENLKNKERKERKERREKRRLKELQDKKELDELLLMKQEQENIIIEKDEILKADQLRKNLMDNNTNHIKNELLANIISERKENLKANKNSNLKKNNVNNKYISNNNVGDLSEYRKAYLSNPKKKENHNNTKKLKVNISIDNKNVNHNGNNINMIKDDKYLTPLQNKNSEISPYMIKFKQHNKPNNDHYIKRIENYDVENVYKAKVIERDLGGGSKVMINRKLSPIKRKIVKENK